jgi:E3 ubiquitin-protein ligase MARCH6
MASSTVFAEGATLNKLQPSPVLPLSSMSPAMYLALQKLEAGLPLSGPSGYFDSGVHSKNWEASSVRTMMMAMAMI